MDTMFHAYYVGPYIHTHTRETGVVCEYDVNPGDLLEPYTGTRTPWRERIQRAELSLLPAKGFCCPGPPHSPWRLLFLVSAASRSTDVCSFGWAHLFFGEHRAKVRDLPGSRILSATSRCSGLQVALSQMTEGVLKRWAPGHPAQVCGQPWRSR